MTDVTTELVLSFVIWPYLVMPSIYLASWIDGKLSNRKVTKK